MQTSGPSPWVKVLTFGHIEGQGSGGRDSSKNGREMTLVVTGVGVLEAAATSGAATMLVRSSSGPANAIANATTRIIIALACEHTHNNNMKWHSHNTQDQARL